MRMKIYQKFIAIFFNDFTGGPMDTWMVKQFPWIVKRKKAIKEFVINLENPL